MALRRLCGCVKDGRPYEHLFDSSPVGLAVLEPDGRFQEVNEAYAESFGLEPPDFEGETIWNVVETSATGELNRETLESGPAAGGETHRVRPSAGGDGTSTVELSLESIDDEGEQYLISTVEAVDSTKSDGVPSELAVEMAGVGIWSWDLETDALWLSDALEGMMGIEPGSFDGMLDSFIVRIHDDDLEVVETALDDAIDTGEFYHTEFRLQTKEGWIWVEARGRVQDQDDGDGRMVGTLMDVTDRKHQERQLGERKREYRELVDRLPGAYYVINQDWELELCNEVLANRLGRSVEDLRGINIWEEFSELEGTAVQETFERTMEEREPASCEFYYEEYDYWVDLQAFPYEDGIAVVSSDISDSKAEVSTILDSMPILLFRVDQEGIFRESRGQALASIGLERREVVGASIYDLYGEYEEVLDAYERALDGEEIRFTIKLQDVIFETQFVPIFENGSVSSVIGVSMDVTELERQREQLEFFNSILRHDVLNGMTVIKTRGELLVDELEGDYGQYAETIVEWTDNVTAVTNRIRKAAETLTTPDEELSLEPIAPAPIVEKKVAELDSAYSSLEVEIDIQDDVRVQADELLADVVGNILSNSIEHNDDSDLTIRSTISADDGVVWLRFADDGAGIPDERKESVFRRGESSHAKETGSGFGLFFADVLATKYGGSIHVEDSEMGGACFVLELPVAQANQEGWEDD